MGVPTRQPDYFMNLDAWRHYLRGRLFQLFRSPSSALAAYREALAADPDMARAAHALAFLLAKDRHYAEAEAVLRVVIRNRPGNAVAWFNLGFVCDRLDRTGEAIEAFRNAVRYNAKLDHAWYGLGVTLARTQRHGEAAEALEQAAKLQPMNGHAWYQLAMSYHALHEADRVKGIVEYLDRFDRHMAHKLIVDSGRSDLAHVVSDLQGRAPHQ